MNEPPRLKNNLLKKADERTGGVMAVVRATPARRGTILPESVEEGGKVIDSGAKERVARKRRLGAVLPQGRCHQAPQFHVKCLVAAMQKAVVVRRWCSVANQYRREVFVAFHAPVQKNQTGRTGGSERRHRAYR